MNIVFVAHFAGSPAHGMVYGHYYLAREWVSLGHSVTIIAASYAHTRFVQPETNKEPTEEFIDGIRYVWMPAPPYDAVSKVGRVVNILSFSFRCWFAKHYFEYADLIVCSSHHPFPIYAAQKFAKKFNARIVFEVRDLWPLTLIELGGVSNSNPFIWLMQRAEDYAYRNAEYVVSVLPAALEYMVSRGMDKEKFVYVPNGVNMHNELDEEPLPQSYVNQISAARNKGKFIVGYAGRVGLANALHTLVDSVAADGMEDVFVAILGDGAYVSELRTRVNSLGISDRVVFLKSVKKEQVVSFLKLVDAAYIGLQNQPLFRFGVSPTKLNDYMLASKPIIYAIDSPNNIVDECGAGLSCQAENPKELSRVIAELKSLEARERDSIGKNGRRWIELNRDYKMLAIRFLEAVT